jgi:hypothetical protein
MFVEIIEAVCASPIVKAFIEGLCIKIVADLLHRRATDPNFLIKSDAAFASISAAKTSEDQIASQKALAALMSSG